MRRLFGIIVIALFTASCAYVISKDVRKQAVKGVSYSMMKENIGIYNGSVFIFGGFIAKSLSNAEGTWLEIVQNPTDKYGNITSTDFSEGRSLALYKGHLDPLIYEKGRLLTIAGELTGTQKGSIGQMEYTYPIFTIKEVYLWQEQTAYFPYDYNYPPSNPWGYDPWRWWYGPYFP